MTAGTSTIRELDSVELVVDLPDAPLEYPEMGDAPLHAGDRGVVVFVYDARAFAVEFFRDEETVAIADVTADQVRLVESHVPASDNKESPTETGMRIEFALLADRAESILGTPRLNIQNAGVWSGNALSLPASYPNISVIIGVGYTADALDKDHTVTVRFVNPDGGLVGPAPNAVYNPALTKTHPKSDPRFEPESIIDTVHVPYATPFLMLYGRYEFRIALDGEERRTIYFTLSRPIS